MLGKAHLARILAAVIAIGIPSASFAQSLMVNGSGQLTGATDVNVNGSLYNVTFAQCSAGSSGFSAACTPYFTNATDAAAAAQALLDQVFVDGPSGMFDSNPGLTLFCNGQTLCSMAVPYTAPAHLDAETAFNSTGTDSVGYQAWYYNGSPYFQPLNVAEFSAVPEPSAWAMMLLGVGAIGVLMRRRRSIKLASARA